MKRLGGVLCGCPRTVLLAAVAGGVLGIVCSTVSCIKLCMMEQMLCSSVFFKNKLK